MTTTDVQFEDPGDPGAVTGMFEAVFAACRENPGAWAILRETDSPNKAGGMISRVREGRYKGCSPGEFEVTSRKRGPIVKIYVRYPEETVDA